VAVYKRTYRPYSGPLTPHWSRFLVITRYAFEELMKSRGLVLAYTVGLAIPLGFAIFLYVNYNTGLLELLGIKAKQALTIDPRFFLALMGVESTLGFFLSAFIGPGLISPDLANNALPLYLARPFSRAEYILGKTSVLALMYSGLTWIPGLLLFGLQGYLAGTQWTIDNWRIAWTIFAGSWLWILVISLLALALSAWVKWKPAAGGLLFGVFFVTAGFGHAVNAMLRTTWGSLLNVNQLMGTAWLSLLGEEMQKRNNMVPPRSAQDIPLWCTWMMLAIICAFCLWLLSKKVRGAEIVK
jgi:ABC-2 type transport system permease protein